MANLFLGFPVPRAKIADMISGSAPPSLHKTQHQDGGTDEIDCTGLVGAGGGDLAFSGLLVADHFESVGNFYTYLSGTGAANNTTNGIQVTTGATASSFAEIIRQLWSQDPLSSWNKPRKWKLHCRLYAATNSTGTWFIATGGIGAQEALGFYCLNGVLKSHCHDGTTLTQNALVDWGAAGFDKSLSLSINFTPGVSAKYYVNGELLDTITANLPTGTQYAANPIHAKVTNEDQALIRLIDLTQLQMFQAAA